MALSVPFVGSGEFVPEIEWSCPDHAEPQTHECDCDLCDVPYYTCEGCANADWVEKRDADGNVVMRELSKSEVAFRELVRQMGSLGAVTTVMKSGANIEWIEDEMLPRTMNG